MKKLLFSAFSVSLMSEANGRWIQTYISA